MLAYSMILFAAAALSLGFAIAIYRGSTNLIHDYHQTHVKEADQEKYGRAFSKGLFVLTGSLIFSGIIALLGETPSVVIVSVSVSLAGIVISLLAVAKVQKEFNGGFIR
ncbi:MAG: hypothetical protein K1W21_08325 [Oscillospiraceae bacterium]